MTTARGTNAKKKSKRPADQRRQSYGVRMNEEEKVWFRELCRTQERSPWAVMRRLRLLYDMVAKRYPEHFAAIWL